MENEDGRGPPGSRRGRSRSPPDRARPPAPHPEGAADERRDAHRALATSGTGAPRSGPLGRGRDRAPRRRHHPEIAGLDFPEAVARIRESLDERVPLLGEFRAGVAAVDREHPEWRQRNPVVIPAPEIRNRIGEIPVAALPDDARSDLTPAPNARSPVGRVVWLSPETALKQRKHEDEEHRKPLDARHYRRLPDLVEYGERERMGHRHLAFYHRIAGDWFRVVVKRTTENEIYLKTFHRVRERHLPPTLRRASRTRNRVAHGGARPPAEAGNPT